MPNKPHPTSLDKREDNIWHIVLVSFPIYSYDVYSHDTRILFFQMLSNPAW